MVGAHLPLARGDLAQAEGEGARVVGVVAAVDDEVDVASRTAVERDRELVWLGRIGVVERAVVVLGRVVDHDHPSVGEVGIDRGGHTPVAQLGKRAVEKDDGLRGERRLRRVAHFLLQLGDGDRGQELQEDDGMAILFITHDLGVVAQSSGSIAQTALVTGASSGIGEHFAEILAAAGAKVAAAAILNAFAGRPPNPAPVINNTWGGAAPDGVPVGADNFSVRWSGQVEPRFTETYTFYTQTDDGARLWVNGVQLVNDWTDHGVILTQKDVPWADPAGQSAVPPISACLIARCSSRSG